MNRAVKEPAQCTTTSPVRVLLQTQPPPVPNTEPLEQAHESKGVVKRHALTLLRRSRIQHSSELRHARVPGTFDVAPSAASRPRFQELFKRQVTSTGAHAALPALLDTLPVRLQAT
jgi:hypothetical protein